METNEQQINVQYYINLLLKRRKLAILSALCMMTLGIAASFTVPTLYEASSTVLVERDIINDLMRDITTTTSVQDRVKALSVVLTSRNQLIKVMSDLDMAVERMPEDQVEGMIRSLQGRTQVRMTASGSGRPGERDIFTVSFRGRDPRFARDYVNALIRRYIESNLSSSREAAYGANRFILEQLNMYKERIDRIKSELANRKNESVTALNERLLAEQLNIAADVIFPGFDPEPYPILSRSDLFVLSSRWEGSPNALCEALALGTPVVATDCPSGPREILNGGRVAPLVPVDDVEAMARAMGQVLDEPGNAEKRKAAVAEYTVDTCAARYEALFESLSKGVV